MSLNHFNIRPRRVRRLAVATAASAGVTAACVSPAATFSTTVRAAALPAPPATAPAAARPSLTATGCVVPSLVGKTLRTARQVLLRADCRLGAVAQQKRKRRRTPRSTLRVAWQSAKPGSKRPIGFHVSVKLAAAARRSGPCFMSWCFSAPVEMFVGVTGSRFGG